MKTLETYYLHTRKKFKDSSVLGVFVENHDNPRFLNRCNNWKKFKNAIIFSLFYEGIPVVYYGGEQFFSGGDDPLNREILWGKFNTNSEMYIAIREAIRVRKRKKIYNKKFVQRFADNSFYAFTRGDVLICVLEVKVVIGKLLIMNLKKELNYVIFLIKMIVLRLLVVLLI